MVPPDQKSEPARCRVGGVNKKRMRFRAPNCEGFPENVVSSLGAMLSFAGIGNFIFFPIKKQPARLRIC
jgi:hypothetical protein